MNPSSKEKTVFSVLLLLPIIFIAYFAIAYSSNSIDPGDISAVTVTLPGSEPLEFKNASDISFYANAVMDASEIASPLRPLNEGEAVKLVCDRGDKLLEFTLYPELSLTGCMLDKHDGKLYVLDNETARALLSRSEYSYLYESRFTKPLLLTSGGSVTKVMPSVYEWKYRLISGEYSDYDDSDVYDGVTVYSLYSDRTNSLSFDVPPQSVTVEITDENGDIVPESDVSKLIFARDTLLNIKVSAEWSHSSDSLFYGRATYEFRALYDVPSTISMSANAVEAGGAVLINVRHLNDAETLNVDSSLKVSSLAFSENNGYKTAVLAVDAEAQPGEYDIVFTIGENVITEKLTVLAANRDFHRISIDKDAFDRLLGDPAVKELEGIIRNLNSAVSPIAYGDPSEPLRAPTDTGTLEINFGTQVLMNIDNSTDSHACLSIGKVYKCVDGAKVCAAKAGKVVYSGMTLMLGNVVVIDHGCGLQTWYYCLKSTERSVGEELKAGDVVGFAGSNDYVSGPRICFASSVCGVFADVK